MTKDVIRLTYRLSKKLYEQLEKSAKNRCISVNAEINRILFEYYFEKQEKR